MPFPATNNAVIYDGFFTGSTLVKVRVQDITPGDQVLLYDEDSLIQLGSAVSTSEDIEIVVDPLSSRRIIAFVETGGSGTAGGVDVILSNNIYTGWKTPEPVDEESVPVEIGLYNPGALHPLTARYDPSLIDSIPQAYYAAAIGLISDPIVFDVSVIYRVDQTTDDNIAIVSISSVKNARGSFVSVIDGTTASSKTFSIDKTFDITITDSESRITTKTISVNPVTGYMPTPPAPTPSTIKMYLMSADFGQSGFFARGDARSTSPLEISYDGGTTYEDMASGGTTRYGSLRNGVPPGSITIVIRVKSNPSDFVSETIPVPYP